MKRVAYTFLHERYCYLKDVTNLDEGFKKEICDSVYDKERKKPHSPDNKLWEWVESVHDNRRNEEESNDESIEDSYNS